VDLLMAQDPTSAKSKFLSLIPIPIPYPLSLSLIPHYAKMY